MHGYPVMQVVQYHIPPALPHCMQVLPHTSATAGGGVKKYVFCCCACGGLATILGALFLTVYFLLRMYTTTLGYFETIPTFVPATMLILTGLCVISLARRKNRHSYLIKACGLCCLVCALTCVLVTITTTVIHINRLQTLRECVYTQKTRTCTCYSVLLEAQSNADDGMRYVFDSTPDCEVIHGALYSCLRAIFGLSVSGILVCIFSCMLVYQLLSHEKKKMYWEQLELRCRSMYQQQTLAPNTHSTAGEPPVPMPVYCTCCEDCRYPPILVQPQVYSRDANHPNDRFWSSGRAGNFYSPNPETDPSLNQEMNRCRPGWSWRRFPWNRTSAEQASPPRDNSLTYQGGGSADSQYGFSSRAGDNCSQNDQLSASTRSYGVLDERSPSGGVYFWGPPPPYSNPNSPVGRQIHQYNSRCPSQHHHRHRHPHTDEVICCTNETRNSRLPEVRNNKHNYENTGETETCQRNYNSENTDTSSSADKATHTLPVRKMKKRSGIAFFKVSPELGTNQADTFGQRPNDAENDYHEPNVPDSRRENQECRYLPRLQGVENAAFQKHEKNPQKPETSESEVYFADVSSCCNISVRNDEQDSNLYDEAIENRKPVLMYLQKPAPSKDDAMEPAGNAKSRSHRPSNSPEEVDFGTDPHLLLLPKDLSQNSLCGSVQTPVTDTTDDVASPDDSCGNYFQDLQNEQLSKHREFVGRNNFRALDAQYETIPEPSSFCGARGCNNPN
ncbi:uncharacterized protein LOC132705112 isoform X2 [Cylas formicarius]|uniref:uncharacterized protein LOC132705112 isoform X2 n=1 Tax=Cylas formicarius TaxID=197179 RepID=UPI002958DBAD|nr:uncharacterized protein LOC132705112 isoform X2 [Cylas formicarius]